MKKFISIKLVISFCLVMLVWNSGAQNEIMRVYHNGNLIFAQEISKIDSITFNEPTTITFMVFSCNQNWDVNSELYTTANNATINIHDCQNELVRSYQTDTNGQAIALLAPGQYSYIISKDNEKNISQEGYIINGVFASQEEINNSAFQSNAKPGDIKYLDLNGDGIINIYDVVERVDLTVNEDKTVEAYISIVEEGNIIEPETIPYSMLKIELEQRFKTMLQEAWQINAALTHDVNFSITKYKIFSTFNFFPHNTEIINLWNAAYRLNQVANITLDKVEKTTNITQETKLQYIAETLYYRTYAYLTLLNYFGGVPIVTTTINTNYYPSRNSENDVINFIFSNLDIIANTASDSLRYIALQLKARIHLNFLRPESYTEITNACKAIIDSEAFSIPVDNLWGEDAISVGINMNLPENMQKGDLSYPVRYAETILMYAEAENELNGPHAEILQQINQLESWKNMPNTESDVTKDELRTIIYNLWRDLLNNEGQTFALLKRTGRFLDVLGTYGATAKHVLLPIPQNEIDINPNMTQNPGW